MGLFGRSRSASKASENQRSAPQTWATRQITQQESWIATAPPDLATVAQRVVATAGRGREEVALQRLMAMVGFDMDIYAAKNAELSKHDFSSLRDTLHNRPDFEPRMLFDSLTYYGAAGVALNNMMITQIPTYEESLVDAASEGYLD